jgi:hypothetical protein
MARFTDETVLLIPGVKGKVNEKGEVSDRATVEALEKFSVSFTSLVLQQKNPAA